MTLMTQKSITFTTFDGLEDFDTILVGKTNKGVCALYFGANVDTVFSRLQEDFKGATLTCDAQALADEMTGIIAILQGVLTIEEFGFSFDIESGTTFQQKVWQALCTIPTGQTRTYGEIAVQIGDSKAARAVGTACGQNPIALLIPCHRVVPSTGGVGNYAYGAPMKEMLLIQEQDEAFTPVPSVRSASMGQAAA